MAGLRLSSEIIVHTTAAFRFSRQESLGLSIIASRMGNLLHAKRSLNILVNTLLKDLVKASILRDNSVLALQSKNLFVWSGSNGVIETH